MTESILAPRIRAMGVFSPIASEPEKGGASRLARYEAWLGRRVSMVTDNASETGDWDQLKRTAAYAAFFWSKKPVTLLLRVPLLPASHKGQFKQGAAGAFDAHFSEIARGLVPMLDRKIAVSAASSTSPALPPVAKADLFYMPCSLILGLGWENNGNWYPWFGKPDPGAYKAFYERIVGVFRSVDPRFRFDWNTTLGTIHVAPDLILPHPSSFDTLGVDVYDEFPTSQASRYGFGQEAARWRDRYQGGKYGLDWWAAKAAELDKGLTVPEWGVTDWRKPEAGMSGGDDNPYFVERMAAWFDGLGDRLAYHSYFERFYKGTNHSLSRGPMGPDGTTPGPSPLPKSAARFKALFGG